MPVSSHRSRLPLVRLIGLVSAIAFGFGLNTLFSAARPEIASTKGILDDKLEENRIAAREASVPPQGFGMSGSESGFNSFRPSFIISPNTVRYKITELDPKLEQYPSFQPRTINNQGDVIGNAYSANKRDPPSPRHLGFFYRKGKFEQIPTPDGYDHVILMDMNDKGQATGVAIGYKPDKRPFATVVLYEKGKLRLLHEFEKAFGQVTKPISTELTPRLSNNGSVTAWYYGRTYLWQNGKVTDLGRGRVLDINNRGVSVGVVESRDGGATYWKDGKAFDLLTPGRFRSPQGNGDLRGSAEAVNDKGQVVVSMPLNPGARYHEQRTLYVLTDGKKDRPIATVLGPQWGRTRMNNRGDVVGLLQLMDMNNTVPFLYSGGKMYDINAAVEKQNWVIHYIMDINDKGEMIALAMRPGTATRQGILLTPIEP